MIYFLCGLLTLHGIVCLVGAFIPVYPPVFFFYAFFPGPFIIKLIIVLLAGAAQLAYGVSLIFRKRRQIKWYWPAIATVIITGLLLIYPTVQNPGLFGVSAEKDEIRQPILFQEMPPVPAPGEEAADDIMPAPGMGPAYRANIHQTGVENPWPPIDTTKVTIASSFEADTVYVRYREHIETEAGESRNNAVSISMGNREVGKLNLYTIDLPAGIEVTEGMRWHGPGPVSSVLVIDISPDVQPGQYDFGIAIEIDGRDYAVLPCTIKVVETLKTVEDEITPKAPYYGNHGITTTRVTQQPGDKGILVSVNLLPLTLDDLVLESDVIVIGKVVDILPAKQDDTQSDKPTIYTDVVIEAERYLYGKPKTLHVAVRVKGGRVGDTFMRVDASPVFDLDEGIALFLSRMSADSVPPDRIESVDYYSVTGYNQGKRQYSNGILVDLGGISVAEFEQEIAEVHEFEGED